MSQYPGALPPPPGVTADINAPRPALQNVWIAALVVELAVPTILALMRIYVRLFLLRRWKLVDYVFVLAWALFVCEIGLGLSLVQYDVGQNAWNIAPEVFSKFAENLNIQQVVYMPAICFTKMAILLQFAEIFVPSASKKRWWIILGFIVFNVIFFTILLFIEIFNCTPRAKIWNPSLPGTCLNIEETFVATGVINVVEDFAILALPMYWISKLRMSTARKASIAAIFAVGLFACACSVLRLAESVISLSSSNITVSLLPVSLWATAEISAGLVVACLPYMPRLFKRSGPATQMQQSDPQGHTPLNQQRRDGSSSSRSTVWDGKPEFENGWYAAAFSTAGTNTQDRPLTGITKSLDVDQYSEERAV